MKRGFAQTLVLFVVFIALVIFGYIQIKAKTQQIVSPTYQASSPDPYSNWNTYKNDTYKFTARYPKQWHLRQYQDYAAEFLDVDPKEATPGAIKARFLRLEDSVDLKEFEKVQKLEPSTELREPLDVKSTITKVDNHQVGPYQSIEYVVNRYFTAPEGPRANYSRIYKINREGIILTFLSEAKTQEEQKVSDPIFEQMITSIDFF